MWAAGVAVRPILMASTQGSRYSRLSRLRRGRIVVDLAVFRRPSARSNRFRRRSWQVVPLRWNAMRLPPSTRAASASALRQKIAHVRRAQIASSLEFLALLGFPPRDYGPARIGGEDRRLLAKEEDAVARLRLILLGAPDAMAPDDRQALELEMRRQRVGRGDLVLEW